MGRGSGTGTAGKAYATTDEPERVVGFYEQNRGGRPFEKAGGGHWTLRGTDGKLVSIHPKAGRYPSCDVAPGARDRTVLIVSQLMNPIPLEQARRTRRRQARHPDLAEQLALGDLRGTGRFGPGARRLTPWIQVAQASGTIAAAAGGRPDEDARGEQSSQGAEWVGSQGGSPVIVRRAVVARCREPGARSATSARRPASSFSGPLGVPVSLLDCHSVLRSRPRK
jgi:hypothetical protein